MREGITKEPMLTPAEFARRVRVHVKTARAYFYSGAYPTIRVGKRLRMTEATFSKYFTEKQV
jgi:predicted site-specific integrase-resolvase